MRPVRAITDEEENLRVEQIRPGWITFRRDPVEPEPVGTVVLEAFVITGYDRDCDGSLMARLDNIDKDGETTGWREKHIGLRPDSSLVVTPEELRSLFAGLGPEFSERIG